MLIKDVYLPQIPRNSFGIQSPTSSMTRRFNTIAQPTLPQPIIRIAAAPGAVPD